MPRPTRPVLAALFLALLAFARPSDAAVRLDPLQNDSGVFRVYFHDRLLGTEVFSLEPRGDSVLIFANVDQTLPTPDGDRAFEKKIQMTVKAIDYGLLGYSSEQDFLGRKALRGVNVYDTTITTFREVMGSGSAEAHTRPPGRLFVIDSQVFVLFDVMLRSLHGKMIGERPLSVVVLGEPADSVMDIRFLPGEADTLRIGGRRRPARQVLFSDGTTEFRAWVAPDGSMLRLEQPAVGLRVDRVAEPPKKARPTGAPAGKSGSSPPPGSSPAPGG